jgi:uncharacterized protein (DUF1778 family)
MSAAVLERPSPERVRARSRRDTTINIRMETETRDLIDKAAAVLGKSRSDFMVESARQHAIDVLLDQRLFVLNSDQYDAFVKALDNPPAPNAKLKALMKRRPVWEK